MLKDTGMTSFLILHQMANEKGVRREKMCALVLGIYILFSLVYMCIYIYICVSTAVRINPKSGLNNTVRRAVGLLLLRLNIICTYQL